MELRSPKFGKPVSLEPFKPFEFDGAVPIDCSVSAPTLDFNLILRSSEFELKTELYDLRIDSTTCPTKGSFSISEGTALVFFVMNGSVDVDPINDRTLPRLCALDAIIAENFDGSSKALLTWSASRDAVLSCHRICRTNHVRRTE